MIRKYRVNVSQKLLAQGAEPPSAKRVSIFHRSMIVLLIM